MHKKGDLVVVTHIGEASQYFKSKFFVVGTILQLTSSIMYGLVTEEHYTATFTILSDHDPDRVVTVNNCCCAMKIRKIDHPLKFRGGKVINVEEATSPF